jgi:hypothetical protein
MLIFFVQAKQKKTDFCSTKEMLLIFFHTSSCFSFAVTLLITVGACHSKQATTGEQSFQFAASPCAVSMSTASIQMGKPLNLFSPTETLKFRRTAAALSSVTPQQERAHAIFSLDRICMMCSRNLVWEIASGAAIAGSNYCDKSAVWSHTSQHHPGDFQLKNSTCWCAGYRISHTRSVGATGVVPVCGSERSNFSAQASRHCVRRASHQTLHAALGSHAS